MSTNLAPRIPVRPPRLCHPDRPAEDDLPLERLVDCDCDDRLHHPVLWLHADSHLRIGACLGCGRTRASRPMDAGGIGDVPGSAVNRLIELPPSVGAWLSRWPRLAAHRSPLRQPIWLPADTRCRDFAELERRLDEAAAWSRPLTAGQRLGRAGLPTAPAPAELNEALAESLAGFVRTGALIDDPGATVDPDRLLELASPRRATWPVAVDRLLADPELPLRLPVWLWDPAGPRWDAVLNVLRWQRPLSKANVDALFEALARFPIERAGPGDDGAPTLRAALDFLAEARPPAAWVAGPLAAFGERLEDRHPDLARLARRVGRTVAEGAPF